MLSLTSFSRSARARRSRSLFSAAGSACGLILVLAWGGSLSTAAGADPLDKVAPDLRAALQRRPDASVSVIVQMGRSFNAADRSQVARLGGSVRAEWTVCPGYAAELPAAAVAQLASLPHVRRISPDRKVRVTLDTTARAVGADIARLSYGATGLNVGVAVLDTGIQTGPEFGNSLRGWVDFVNGKSTPYDDHGHGTHVAGVLTGTSQATIDAGSPVRHQGMIPRCNLVALKVLGRDGSGLVSTIISAINWCVANRSLYRLRVINLSLGHVPAESYATDPLGQACASAVKAGIVVCAAAGNWGKDALGRTLYGGILNPGVHPSVLTVGAANTSGTRPRSDDRVCTYSSRGPTYLDRLAKPDLLAPGNRIVSVRATQSYLDTTFPGNRLPRSAYLAGATGDSPYFVLSGTSMATPAAAAAAAMLFERNPGLSANAAKAILMYSAQRLALPLTPGLSDLTQGAGCLNIPGALEIATRINASAPSGAYWLTQNLSGSNVIQGEAIPWGRGVLWGNDMALGDTIHYRQFAWSDNVAWGEGGTWSSNVAWGENAVTSDPSWLEAAVWSDPPGWSTGAPEMEALIGGE